MAIVWQLSINQHKNGSTIHGVILKDNPALYRLKKGGLVTMFRVLRSYFLSPVAHKEVFVQIPEGNVTTTTDSKGGFTINVDYKLDGIDNIKIDNTELDYGFDYPVAFAEKDGKYEVISDIDDTIMISYTADSIKRVTTLLFKSPQERKKIDYSHQLAQHLMDIGTKYNYVSKSESNLFGLITAFISFQGFPQGDIFLTPYLGLREMLTRKKSRTFKVDMINKIVSNSRKQFILVGDDSQRDIDVYAYIAERFKDKIYRVYIRQTKKKMNSRAQKFMARLKETGVDIVVFMNKDDFKGADELK